MISVAGNVPPEQYGQMPGRAHALAALSSLGALVPWSHWAQVLPTRFQQLEQFLASSEGPYFCGDRILCVYFNVLRQASDTTSLKASFRSQG